MRNKSLGYFAVILFIIGGMLAVQFNTVSRSDPRETRDVWEIRQELSQEKQLHSELLSEISMADDTLGKYEAVASESPEQALRDTVENLREEAGLTELTGPGLEIEIMPSPEAVAFGMAINQITPDLLNRFMNEVNRSAVNHAAIDGQRVINSTAIRDINGRTTVNGVPVSTPPFRIRIVTESMEQAERLYNQLLASPLLQDLYIDNLAVDVGSPDSRLTIPAYDRSLNISHLQPAEEG